MKSFISYTVIKVRRRQHCGYQRKKFDADLTAELDLISKFRSTFEDAVCSIIEQRRLSRKQFCDKTLLSEKTYDRIKSGTIGRVALQTVVQIAVGLKLGGLVGEFLMELAGYKLLPHELVYKKVLFEFREHSIYECDRILTSHGLSSIIPKQYRAAK